MLATRVTSSNVLILFKRPSRLVHACREELLVMLVTDNGQTWRWSAPLAPMASSNGSTSTPQQPVLQGLWRCD